MSTQYLVRQREADEFIEGNFNERSIIGIFHAKNYMDLYFILNEILYPSDIAFAETPIGSGIIFTQEKVEFEPVFHLHKVKFEQMAFEPTKPLHQALQEGIMEWKIYEEHLTGPVSWRMIKKPQLLN
jgi:hypothetical protein